MPFALNVFLLSTGIVALAEIGDKTQLLAFILAARFKRPGPIIVGILVATLLNHAMAGAVGIWLGAQFDPNTLRWVLAAAFVAIAIWVLIPDKMDDDIAIPRSRLGIFGATFIAFFLAEMGDKTQVATIALAAQHAAPVAVILGTTLGMMIANVPAVFVAQQVAGRVPMRLIHGAAAVLFFIMAAAVAIRGIPQLS